MSERDLNRLEVLAQIDDGHLSVGNGANMLGLTRRQIFRLLKRYRKDGAAAIRHKARGRHPSNRIHDSKHDFALALVWELYADFGPTLAAEMLQDHHGLTVSRETLRKWMIEDEDISGYLTTHLVADLFGVETTRDVAEDVARERRKAGLDVGGGSE